MMGLLMRQHFPFLEVVMEDHISKISPSLSQ